MVRQDICYPLIQNQKNREKKVAEKYAENGQKKILEKQFGNLQRSAKMKKTLHKNRHVENPVCAACRARNIQCGVVAARCPFMPKLPVEPGGSAELFQKLVKEQRENTTSKN